MFSVIYVLFLVNIIRASHRQESCDFDEDILKHLGTKTPYRTVANKKDSTIKYKGCQPIKIVGVMRHGTRTPGLEAIEEIRSKLGAIRDDIRKKNTINLKHEKSCEFNLDPIKSWNFVLEKEGDKILTHEGEVEMLKLAHRIKKRFPSLLKEKYTNDSYYFRFTDTQRTKESAKFFTKGLFGNESSRHVWYPEPLSKDPILRFYKLCDKWRQEVKKNPKSLEELNKYLQTNEIAELLQRVSTKIGLDYNLCYDDVRLMYVTCSFETAWYKNKLSPWCTIFSEKDIKALEYAEELKYYWIDGYGYEINHDQACPLIKNVFDIFHSKDGPNSVFYFTHSGTILKTISYLGLYKDDYKLTYNIPSKIRKHRKWKISKIDSFAANLVFVLFRCNDDELKVLLQYQEKILKFPQCNKRDLCPLKKLEEIFNYTNENGCDFSNICSLKSA